MRSQLLSNGRYTVMLTETGSGFSRWRDLAITRWREDPTRDDWGSYLFIRDVDSGDVWSAGIQPCGAQPDEYSASLSDARAHIVRREGALTTTLEVAVASSIDAELRRLTIVNHGAAARTLEVTSYAELVLGSASSDASHPAFSKIFVQTEAVVDGDGILLGTRRKRTGKDPDVWAAHFATGDGQGGSTFSFETDRARFIGRGRTLRNAAAMQGAPLSNTAGTVLDPIFSIRRHVSVAPGARACVAFWTVVADSRAGVLAHCEPLRSLDAPERTLEAATSQASNEHQRLGIDSEQAEAFQRLVGPLLYAESAWRASTDVLERASGGAPVLWAAGISGDRPIMLVRIGSDAVIERVSDVLKAQTYWRSKRFGIDVVVLNTAAKPTADRLQSKLQALLQSQTREFEAESDGAKAGVFALRDSEVSDALRDGLAAAARVVLYADDDERNAAAWRSGESCQATAALNPVATPSSRSTLRTTKRAATAAAEPLEFYNGIGGFAQGGREYAITLDDDHCTPMPWINVISNPSFGFIVSAEGGGYTWSINSQQNPLTPWPNDPVSDSPHEVVYLRDEDSGEVWSATASPIRVPGVSYSVHHGKGYSRFEHTAHGVEVALLQFVPLDDSIKLSRLRLSNRSGRTRRLSITAYVEWALGPNGTTPAPFVVTSIDAATGALFSRNPWRAEFGERIAFADLAGSQTSYTGDRAEFLGHHGAVESPAALRSSAPLSGRAGAGIDPCGALQTQIELATDSEIEIVILLGDAASHADAQALIKKYRAADLDVVLREVTGQWGDILNTVQVRTPDRALDLLLNDWLLYQTLSCRIWARSAYYQSSGAYGFRDQLQDVMALAVARPDIAREHLLRSASRQFAEGDVQHWWLPPAGQGVRTTMTDDRVWLPYVATQYIGVTGDAAALDEQVHFIEGEPLKDDQHEAFFTPSITRQKASLYEHCARAIDVSLSLGEHGLPLIGTGDWNDGMNRVGEEGRGESVWLAWLLIATIDAFVPYAQAHKDNKRAARWLAFAATLRATLEGAGWDGQWYRRGYYDDGTPLGSSESSECRIDVIAQSWSVIARAADHSHSVQAMAAVDEHLIRDDDRVALLFTPPFDQTPLEPGYIKGYPPGIRENGGQYTHGAIWSVFAFAMLGDGDRAGSLFNIRKPISHSSTPNAVQRYKVEPYVACADVYSVAPHVGRGGWTWYTGSGGWLYRAGLEAILGFNVQGDTLVIEPCLPPSWPGYEIVFRRRGAHNAITRYEIAVENPHHSSRGVAFAELDGVRMAKGAARIPLVDDSGVHRVHVVLA